MHRVLFTSLILLIPAGSSYIEPSDICMGTFGNERSVVVGYIENSRNVAQIKFSKTICLQNSRIVTEDNAFVVVENSDNVNHLVHKKGNGIYEFRELASHRFSLEVRNKNDPCTLLCTSVLVLRQILHANIAGITGLTAAP